MDKQIFINTNPSDGSLLIFFPEKGEILTFGTSANLVCFL